MKPGAAARNLDCDSDIPESREIDVAPRILVVDDVADNRDILTRRLVRRGFDVSEAVDGADSLEKIAKQTFDLILLDIMMPDMNGNEVLSEIRQTYSEFELPVIMVTAKSQSEDVVESLNKGASDYITKPVDFEVALARINSQLERKKAEDRILLSKRTLEEKTKLLDMTLEAKADELRREAAKRHMSEEKLHFLAFHDSLTGLLNRQGFRDTLKHTLEKMPETGLEPNLLFIDLDGFKLVNDTHGHEFGDKLLVQVGERLVETVKNRFDIARIGGDEFAIITLFAEQPDSSLELAKQVVQALSTPFSLNGKPVLIGASCGVARAPESASDPEEMIKAADLAMYHAKTSGRGSAVLFETRMLREQEERRELELDLRLAVQQAMFEVFYQPLIDVTTQRIAGFEALLRWPHKTRGMISPDVFIPLAEEIGLINQLGNWVLRQACEEAVNWPSDIKIAVNLSPLQFESQVLIPMLVNTLASTGLDPKRLELEITESALLGTEGKNVQILEAIRELGVRVSVDDFGTGYSSLTYLKNFRFDKIKIDRRFVQGLESSISDGAIFDAIINLSRSIGIETTAEGVENRSQLESIVSRGCKEGQGYLFSRPMTSEDAKEFIEKYIVEA